MPDNDECITEQLKASSISSQGLWTLSNGMTIDLRNVQLQLPSDYGREGVSAVIFGTYNYIENCPMCHKSLADSDSLFIIMEKHFYLVGKCCDTMMLYDIETTNKDVMNEWI